MKVTLAGSFVERTWTPDELPAITVELAAFDGDVGTGSIVLEDPAGTDDPHSHRQLKIAEDGGFIVVDGFVGTQTRQYSTDATAPNLSATHAILDPNQLLHGFAVEHWKRDEEDDVLRVLAFAAAYLPGFDTTWVLDEDNVTLPAKTFDGIGADELISDLVEWTGKTMFVHGPAGARCLHYHVLGKGHAAGISISDVDGDIDNIDVWSPDPDFSETVEPGDLVNKVIARGTSPETTVTRSDATSIADHDADGVKHELIADFETDDLTELTALADRLLAQVKDERETYTVRLAEPLDEAALAKIGAGYLIAATLRAARLTASTQRIASMSLTPATRPGYWFATLELGAPIRLPMPKKGKPGTKPCTDEEGAPITGDAEWQWYGPLPGRWIDDYGVIKTAGGIGHGTAAPAPVGWSYNSAQLVIIEYPCAGLHREVADPHENHIVMRFDTRGIASECLDGATLRYTMAEGDCACGPYELAWGGALMAEDGDTLAVFRKGTPIGTIDLTQAGVELEYDVPKEAIKVGGYTYLVIRPKWRGGCAVACGDAVSCDGTPVSDASVPGQIDPCNVHYARFGDPVHPPTLAVRGLVEAGCQTGWVEAECATTEDCAAASVNNCDDPCCVQWWKVPCGHYKPGSLQVSCGGRVLRRGSTYDFAESNNRKCFRLYKPCCEKPQVRYVMA